MYNHVTIANRMSFTGKLIAITHASAVVNGGASTPAPALEQPLQLPSVESTPEVTALHEPLYRVLLHNDDVTPFDYVMSILGKVFMLSEELAEHIATTAHSEGISVVIIRHRSEAQRLSEVANRSARADGFPLTFTCEPDT